MDDVPKEGDPKPRDLFSVLFKSPYLRRVPIGDVTTRTGDSFGEEGIRELTERLMAGEVDIDITTTVLYADWKKRKPPSPRSSRTEKRESSREYRWMQGGDVLLQ